MRKSLGEQIKFFAGFIFGLEFVGIFIYTIYFISENEFSLAFLTLFGGSLAAFIMYFLFYGFGYLIEKVDIIETHIARKNADESASNDNNSFATHSGSAISYGSSLEQAADAVRNQKTVAAGGWTCSCGRTHPPYVSSCYCGKSKHDRT